MKLSFIIPLYNAEAYIGKCLDSILDSDLDRREYEIIVIDDGSKDNGQAVVRQYAQKYDNIKLLVQENQGQSVARNYGIREAKGEYIWFIDSDDKMSPEIGDAYKRLVEYNEVDICGVHLVQVSEADEFLEERNTQPTVKHYEIMTGRDAIISGYNPSSVCALITKRSLFERFNLKFVPGLTHQDVELSYKMMAYAEKVVFTDIKPYIYILHPGSTSKAINPVKKIKYISDDVAIAKSFMNLSDTFRGVDDKLASVIKNRSQNVLFGLVYSLYKNKKTWKPMGINEAVIKKMKDEGVYPLSGHLDSWKKTILSRFLNFEFIIK